MSIFHGRVKKHERESIVADPEVCLWGEFGDEREMDVSTQCGEAMFEYEGDEMHWELEDGDECPFCGKPIKRMYGWLIGVKFDGD